MGLKIIILVLITILAFLAVDLKKISENKIKTSIICFILLLSFVFTVRDYFIEERKTEEKEIFSKKQHHKTVCSELANKINYTVISIR